jgi:hypothetical protein
MQYRNKSKSQLTIPTPAQLPAVAVSSGHIVYTVRAQNLWDTNAQDYVFSILCGRYIANDEF